MAGKSLQERSHGRQRKLFEQFSELGAKIWKEKASKGGKSWKTGSIKINTNEGPGGGSSPAEP